MVLLGYVFVILLTSSTSSVFATFSEIYRNLDDASQKCQDEFGELSGNVARKMLDSSTKIPEGLLSGRFYHLGDFDQCYGIDKLDGITGKYCLGTLNIDLGTTETTFLQEVEEVKSKASKSLLLLKMALHMAYCVPSGCSANDLTLIAKEVVTDVINGTLIFDENYCYSRATDPDLSAGAITTISILSIFGAIFVASTLYDIKLFYTKQKAPHDLLIAFSGFSNGKKLLAATTNKDQLLCLNGIKAISMAWILLGHVCQNAMEAPLYSYNIIGEYLDNPANRFIIGIASAVDSFLMVGGLVLVYVFLKGMDKPGAKFNVIMYYVHRYIRLTPILGIIVLIEATVMDYMNNGPNWGFIAPTLTTDCKEHWWSALLYIQNYAHGTSNCLPQAWYLSVDFQIFLLSPLVLIPLHRWPKIGLAFLGLLIVGGVVIPFAIVYHYEISVSRSPLNEYMFMYYKMTHTRYGPYVIGMLLGYFIYQLKSKKMRMPKLKPIVIILAWLISLGGLVACLYAPAANKEYHRLGSALQTSLVSNAWAVALGGLVFLCVTGYGGPLDWFLSLPIFQFLSKISYAMYLVHYQFIVMRYASSRVNIHFSHVDMMWSFWGDFILSLVTAVILYLVFESPMMILEKFMFGGGEKKPTRKNDVKPNDAKKVTEA